MSEKISVDCPLAEESREYTTEECRDCCLFWDCKIGLYSCLEDKNLESYHDEIRNVLNGD